MTDQEMAQEVFDAAVRRGHAFAAMAMADQELTLSGDESDVLDVGVSAGVAALFDVMKERGWVLVRKGTST